MPAPDFCDEHPESDIREYDCHFFVLFVLFIHHNWQSMHCLYFYTSSLYKTSAFVGHWKSYHL